MSADRIEMGRHMEAGMNDLHKQRLLRIAKQGPDRSYQDADICRVLARAAIAFYWPKLAEKKPWAPVAQSEEQPDSNRQVAGSSPAGGVS